MAKEFAYCLLGKKKKRIDMKQNTFWMEISDAVSFPDVCPISCPEMAKIYMKNSFKKMLTNALWRKSKARITTSSSQSESWWTRYHTMTEKRWIQRNQRLGLSGHWQSQAGSQEQRLLILLWICPFVMTSCHLRHSGSKHFKATGYVPWKSNPRVAGWKPRSYSPMHKKSGCSI